MSKLVGTEAVVVGAGMAGLAAAKALSRHFEHVTILDRDALPAGPEPRAGTPQARHPHVLLLSGQRTLEELFPGCERALEAAGAVKARQGLDIIWERPGYDPFPIRDLGYDNFYMSRPLLENVCRRMLAAQRNVEILAGRRVLEFLVDATAVTGVRHEDRTGDVADLRAELVVDASGRSALSTVALATLGFPKPEETEIGVDFGYASAIFEIPEDAPKGWKGVIHLPRAPEGSRGAFLLPIENNRWIVGVGGRHDEAPSGDFDEYMAILRGLRTSTIYNALRGAKRVSDVARFNLRASVRRHFEKLPRFPKGWLALGDALCRFNPVYGQGMSVAAMEARVLDGALNRRANDPDPLDGLAAEFFQEVQPLLATPWSVAEMDFIFPQTRGERPADLDQRMRFGAGLLALAAQDAEVHKTMIEVNMLLKPGSVLREPSLAGRVMQLLNDVARGGS